MTLYNGLLKVLFSIGGVSFFISTTGFCYALFVAATSSKLPPPPAYTLFSMGFALACFMTGFLLLALREIWL